MKNLLIGQSGHTGGQLTSVLLPHKIAEPRLDPLKLTQIITPPGAYTVDTMHDRRFMRLRVYRNAPIALASVNTACIRTP